MSKSLALHGGMPVRTKPFPAWPEVGPAEEQRVLDALRTGNWGKFQGDEVRQFEESFGEYHGARHAFGVVNGTVALRLALWAGGVGPGDEVIVPPYTFVATASAVLELGAIPVFADLELETFNIDPAAIEAVVTPRTRAIVPVHLGGLPCQMDAIMAIAQCHRLLVVEDACHAHGARYKGRSVGSLGHAACFSFQSSKNVTCGEGGMILTNDDSLAECCWSIHNCGRVPDGQWYDHHQLGGNHRLGELQGALLNAQWSRFEGQAQRREENGLYLDERLRDMPGIHPQRRTADCTRHAYHLYSFRIDPETLGISRQTLLDALSAEGIPAVAGYPIPLYREPMFLNAAFGPYGGSIDHDYTKTECPRCEAISTEQGVWLPHRCLLGARADMD
ncbi:MAG: DegT/DnrJ/EryC1/StrS family aminotransferase, partial [Pirellulales bacterium]|nr:DegT/DnrJ/EryC1/StrS family aminotransferase [Pirellulales bacterium]